MPSRLVALLLVTCLAWSPSNASVLDTVVPEDMPESRRSATPGHLPPLALIATNAITTELASMKKNAPSDAGVAQIEGMIQMMNKAAADPVSSHRCDAKDTADQATCSAQTTKAGCESVVDSDNKQKCTYQMDGGTKNMADLVTNAKTTINAAVTTMLSGLLSTFANAKVDLKAMDTAIDNSEQTISPTELEAIKTKASTWCEKKRALETAISDASTAASTLTTKLNAPLDLSNVLVKEVGTIGPTDCSQANDPSNARGSTCPTGSSNLADRIKNKINTARGEYLVASWDKFDKDALETTATTATTTAKDAFQDAVKNTATTYHSMCGSSDQVHDTAVTLFNGNNAGRSAMYRSLGVILCHINHMSSGQTYILPTNLLKSGAANPTTSATDCNGKLKADSTIKTELFPDATSNEDSSKACPTQSDYEDDIREYGNLGFDKDESDWSPESTKCAAVTAHVASGVYTTDPGTYNGLTGFVAFNWAHAGADFPDGADPLGETLGEGGCVAGSKICRGRIPTGVSPTHLLVKKDTGQWALWSIDGSAKAIAFLKMAQAHQTACSKANDGAWTPIASSGDGWGCGTSCNVLGYTDGTTANLCSSHSGYQTNGWNYILDDDGHWCNPAFKMGATHNSGIADDYGFVNQGCGKKVGGSMLYLAPVTAHVASGASTAGVDNTAANLQGHWDAMNSASLAKDASGNVEMWTDLSTGGFNLATTTDQTSNRPNLVSAGINGHAAVDFSGTDYLASSIKHPTKKNEPFTWIAVVQSNDAGAYDNIFSTNDAPKVTTSGYPYLPASMSTDREHGWSSTSDHSYSGGTVTQLNTMVIITYTYTGTSFNAWAAYNGAGLGVKQIDNWNPSGNWGQHVHEGYVALGRGMQNGGHPFNGKIGEVLAYTAALSESDLTTIVNGLMAKWS